MLNKKINFVVALIISLGLFSYGYYLDIYGCEVNPQFCAETIDISQGIFLTFVLYALISLLYLFPPQRYFNAWWQFARFGLPLTIAGIVYINLTYDSGLFGFGAGFDLLLISGCYLFFILGTLVQLLRTWMGRNHGQ